MSYTQDYSIESLESLLEKLTGKSTIQLLGEELKKQGIEIVKTETVKLDDDMYRGEIVGLKITLSDGRIFEHKLVKKHTSNGIYGCDYYRFRPTKEKVKVEKISENEG